MMNQSSLNTRQRCAIVIVPKVPPYASPLHRPHIIKLYNDPLQNSRIYIGIAAIDITRHMAMRITKTQHSSLKQPNPAIYIKVECHFLLSYRLSELNCFPSFMSNSFLEILIKLSSIHSKNNIYFECPLAAAFLHPCCKSGTSNI